MKRLQPHVVDLPVMVAARILAQSYLDEADEARKRVLQDADAEALHDFRVGVRRLRSCLRLYRPYVDDTVKRRHRRWLRRMTRATNESRDLEVQLDWLARRRNLEEMEAHGATWLEARLKERMWGARADALRAIRQEFPAGRDELRTSLIHYEARVDATQPHPPTAGAIAGAIVLELANRLESEISSIDSSAANAKVHAARITGKRLRYLLEPLALDVSAGIAMIRKLRRLQDALGNLNDRSVLLTRIETESKALEIEPPESPDLAALPALAALHSHVAGDREALFARLQRRWQRREAKPLLERVRGAGKELLSHRAEDGFEIERKFLLSRMPRMAAGTKVLRIDQGWLPGERLVERIRRVRTDMETRWYRSIKSGIGLQRRETEEEITEPVFRALWRLTNGRRVSKRRYIVPDGDLTWEIDRFTGGKPLLAEVELPTANTPIDPPDWLAKYIVKEVTGDPAYLNVNLTA